MIGDLLLDFFWYLPGYYGEYPCADGVYLSIHGLLTRSELL